MTIRGGREQFSFIIYVPKLTYFGIIAVIEQPILQCRNLKIGHLECISKASFKLRLQDYYGIFIKSIRQLKHHEKAVYVTNHLSSSWSNVRKNTIINQSGTIV